MLQTLAIPLQLVCQLVVPGNFGSGNTGIAIDNPVIAQTPVLPEGYTAFPDIGMAYKLVITSRTWNEARKYCAADEANLAVIDSFKKIQYVMGLGTRQFGIYVGIHRLFDDDEWVSVKTGSPLAAIPWRGRLGDDLKCAALWEDGTGLTAVKCDSTYPAVCEIEIPLSQDVTIGTERVRNSTTQNLVVETNLS